MFGYSLRIHDKMIGGTAIVGNKRLLQKAGRTIATKSMNNNTEIKYIIDCEELIETWNWDKNNSLQLDPSKITCKSGRKVWWKCNKKHEWFVSPSTRYQKESTRGCLYCANKKVMPGYNDLQTTHPVLAGEWNTRKNGNLTPQDVIAGSNKKVWWQCNICEHEWYAAIDNRTHGAGCPKCGYEVRRQNYNKTILRERGSLEEKCPQLLNEWDYDLNTILPSEVSCGSKQRVWWKCWRGHSWQDEVVKRTSGHRKCPVCNQESKTSFPEQAIFYYVLKKYHALNRDKVFGKEIDVYIPELEIGIEYNSLYWHAGRAQHDKEKKKFFKEHGIRIITIEDGASNIIDDDLIVYHNDLAFAIKSLFAMLCIEPPIIDIDKDRIKIYEQYIQRKTENSLLHKNPLIAAEWHPTKNGSLTPDMFDYSSNKIVWWQCHTCMAEWRSKINSRTSNNRGCRNCKTIERGLRMRGKNSPHAKPIIQCTMDNKEVARWDCATQVERATGCCHSNISHCCIYGGTSYGYRWYYLYDNMLKNGTNIPGAITLGIVQDDDITFDDTNVC